MAEVNEGVRLYPAWREAVRRFDAAGFVPGQLVTHAWFWDALGMEAPAYDAPAYEVRRVEAAYQRQVDQMVAFLLTEHQVALDNVYGQGYRIVPPAEQTAWAEREAGHGLRREMGKGFARLTNVNLSALDDAQRRENSDALARLSKLAGMMGVDAAAKPLTRGVRND